MKTDYFVGVCGNCGEELSWHVIGNKHMKAIRKKDGSIGKGLHMGKPIVKWQKDCLCSDEERMPHVN